MLRLAQRRVEACRWQNVTLVESLVEWAALGTPSDTALFCLTHDVLQSEAALDDVFRHLRLGARVAAFGAKTAPTWRVPVNLYVRWKSRRYVTDLDGLRAPWRLLARRLVEFEDVDRAWGGAYIAWGQGAVSSAFRRVSGIRSAPSCAASTLIAWTITGRDWTRAPQPSSSSPPSTSAL